MSFVRIFVPETAWEREVFGNLSVLNEGPRPPFTCIMLANEQETGLYARKALPRIITETVV